MTPGWKLALKLAAEKAAQQRALQQQREGLSSAAAIFDGPPKPPPSKEQIERTKALYEKGAKIRVVYWPAGYYPHTSESDNAKFVQASLSTTASKLAQSKVLTALSGSIDAAQAFANATTGKHLTTDPSPGHLAIEVSTADGKTKYLSIGGQTAPNADLISSALTPLPIHMSKSLRRDLEDFGERKPEILEITFPHPEKLEKFITDFTENPTNYALLAGKYGAAEGSSCASIVLGAILDADYKGVLNFGKSRVPTPQGVFESIKAAQEVHEETERQQVNDNDTSKTGRKF